MVIDNVRLSIELRSFHFHVRLVISIATKWENLLAASSNPITAT